MRGQIWDHMISGHLRCHTPRLLPVKSGLTGFEPKSYQTNIKIQRGLHQYFSSYIHNDTIMHFIQVTIQYGIIFRFSSMTCEISLRQGSSFLLKEDSRIDCEIAISLKLSSLLFNNRGVITVNGLLPPLSDRHSYDL